MGTFERYDTAGASGMPLERENAFPADFAPDEVEFARELRDLFPVEQEELPPLYVQTLMGDPAERPMESCFEEKVTYQVFRRLHLPRRPLFESRPSTRWPALPARAARRIGRTGALVTSLVLALMVVSVLAASPSFAEGLRIIFGRTGVVQVPAYPTSVRPSSQSSRAAGSASLNVPPPATVDWFGSTIGNYTFETAYFTAEQEWSSGPIVDLRYEWTAPTASHGSGLLDVREFVPSSAYSAVLQVVADGSVSPVAIGDQPGAYVDGRWVHVDKRFVWQSGVKSELIMDRDGLILWIVADQRDGIGQDQLVSAATHLASVPLRTIVPQRFGVRFLGREMADSVDSPDYGEVIYPVPAGQSPSLDGAANFVSISFQWDQGTMGGPQNSLGN